MNTKRQIIDIHAHVLPGIDDGARDMEEAVQMLQSAAAQGVTAVIATPHYSRRRSLHELEKQKEELYQRIQDSCPDFRIYMGAELYYHEELIDHLRRSSACTMAGSRYVLVEFQVMATYWVLYQGIRKLISAGYLPILAHVERYQCLRQGENLQELLRSGCKLQMNYGSLAGSVFQSDVRWCRRQVKMGNIHFLGSDMHRMDFRPPEIDRAMKWLLKNLEEREIDRMVYRNPVCILNNEPIH